MAREPALSRDQAESLVQGEEHRLLLRHGKAGIAGRERGRLIDKVARAATFDKAVEVIAAAIGE